MSKNHLTLLALGALFLPIATRAQTVRETVVAAEMAFAAQAAQTSTEAAFLGSSAPTSLAINNGDWVNAQDLWRARPTLPGSRLVWYPLLADVAQSGDLGYTTGPWNQLLNDRPQTAGEYVTVWRRQLDGRLKFAVEMKVERVGSAPAITSNVPAPRLQVGVGTPSAAPFNILLDLDRKFAAAEQIKPGATYQQYLSTEARIYRPGLSMMQGPAAIANMKNLDGSYLFTATTGYMAATGDLGYVVGTLSRPAAGNKHPAENGSYLRIWRREAVAGWRLVLEMFNFEASQSGTPPATGQLPAKGGQ